MLHQAINILKEQTGIETTEKDWGFESVTAEREELDPAIIQISKTELPSLVMTHLFVYVDQELGKDYVVYFLTDINSEHEFTRGLLIEGKLQWDLNGGSHD
ncbi:4'-phosphopantetheinyl transferase [Enterococcus raffinosus]|uniref:4'-phosphopantetheinyl transferase n=1 Tax=Enterococcus raffinosus TaxID=71452 RepID=A0AAW8SSX2_9ENTE|nr:4'-phosphopantetheinyl transferase [Enterococcus raffinosus]MDK7989620.1 4'-phosphopantetheinyl transferase [Enterococcus raffinosus]MDT2537141.1 4'-phosphopantetheinyl transferase [Enterococcus raffinosus]UXJ96054.1 4'-phosphopantetheinyl transferase [Enterococcus raffinosus]